jgi:hypothetical protein
VQPQFSCALFVSIQSSIFFKYRFVQKKSSHLRQGHLSCLFLSGFPTEILYTCLHMCATFPAHLIICDLVTVIFYEEFKLWSSSVCNFLQPPVTLSLLDPNNLLNTLFLNTCICLFQDQVSDPFETTCKVIVWRFSVAGKQETLNSNVRSTKWHLPAVIIMIMENVTIYYQKHSQHLTAGKPDTTGDRSRHIWVQKSPGANMFSVYKEVRRYPYGVVSHKASHALRPLSDLLCVLIWVKIIPDSSTRDLWQIPADT